MASSGTSNGTSGGTSTWTSRDTSEKSCTIWQIMIYSKQRNVNLPSWENNYMVTCKYKLEPLSIAVRQSCEVCCSRNIQLLKVVVKIKVE